MKKKYFLGMIIFFLFYLLEMTSNPVYAASTLPSPAEKKVKSITAKWINDALKDKSGDLLVGTPIQLKDFSVTRHFNIGEPETIPESELASLCEIKETKIPFDAPSLFGVKILYKGEDKISTEEISTKVFLQTTNLKLKAIKARWSGKTSYYVGDTIEKKEIVVDGVYDTINKLGVHTDSTKTIQIKNVQIEPETIKAEGDNLITATFEGFNTTFVVKGYGIKGLKVEYSGPKTMVVGQQLDKKKLKVSKLYTNGDIKKIEDYNINSLDVSVPGPNLFMITYEGFSHQLTINGVEKKPEKIEAKYEGSDLVVGSTIDPTKIIVTAINNDKTKEIVPSGFTISPTSITKIGANVITVTYKGYKDTVNIVGTEVLPTSLVAVYNGDMVIEGSSIKKSDISVTAYFPDGTTKDIRDFELSTETMNTIGIQEVVVEYKKVKASIFVPITAKMVVSISAVYKGGVLVQFGSIDRNDIVVTATYNDRTSANVTDYTMTSTVVTKVGKNIFTIFYGGKNKDLIVEALPRLMLGRGTIKAQVSEGDYTTDLTGFIENQFVREGIQLETGEVDQKRMKKLVRRVHKTNKFLAFEVMVDHFQFDENQYMVMEATIPEGFNPAKVGIYYTPDNSNVMVQQTGGLVSSGLYRFYIYRSGIYIIMEKGESDIGRQELREEENRTPFLVASLPNKMKKKQKKSVKPFLLFAPFENDGFKYESSDEGVATISEEGLITAKGKGETTITVSSNVGGYSVSYFVTVTD